MWYAARQQAVGIYGIVGLKMPETYLRQDRQCWKPIYDSTENVGNLITAVCRK